MPQRPRSYGRLINFSANALNQMCNNLLTEHDLTLAQWVLLSALWREDGMLVSELASYSGNNLPAASRIVDRMVSSGLLERRKDAADGRSVRVYLTNKGNDLRHLSNFYQQVNDRLTRGFTTQEKDDLYGLLERLLNNVKSENQSTANKA